MTRCIIRASSFQERMTYLSEESKVIYESKNVKDEEKVFDALLSCAASCSFPHLPPSPSPETPSRLFNYCCLEVHCRSVKYDVEKCPEHLLPTVCLGEAARIMNKTMATIMKVIPLYLFI